MQKKGYVSFVLHAHLPFIHHPESDDYLEESYGSNEQLFTIQDAPGYTATYDGKYNGQVKEGYSKTY